MDLFMFNMSEEYQYLYSLGKWNVSTESPLSLMTQITLFHNLTQQKESPANNTI